MTAPAPEYEYFVDILKFDKQIEKYIEDFATFSKREREETMEEIHNILMACSRHHSSVQSRDQVLDEILQKLRDDFPIFEGQWEDIENIFAEFRTQRNRDP